MKIFKAAAAGVSFNGDMAENKKTPDLSDIYLSVKNDDSASKIGAQSMLQQQWSE